MSRLLICVFSLLLPAAAMAQEEDQELWLTGGASVKLGEGTKFEFDTVSRFGNDAGGLYEIEINTLIAHEIAKGVTIGGGYVRNVNYSRGTVTRTEDRLRVQLGLSGNAGAVRLSGRLRVEQRWRTGGDDIGYRFRPQIKAALPLGESPFSLVGSHESLIPLNDTDWGEQAGYDRMRNMVGVNWKASKLLSIEAGYLNQYRFGRGGDRDVMDHALAMSVGLSF